MKFTYSWLKNHLDTSASITRITETLTAIGLEVEKITTPHTMLNQCVVGQVVSVLRHPNANKLHVCQVDIGSATVQVICGAPNVKVGLKSIFAPPGVTLPGVGVPLTSTVIRGIASHGMLCSDYELSLSPDHTRIIEISHDVAIGTSCAQGLGLDDDPVIEIGLTPNRSDCTGVHGIARDLAAAGLGCLKPIKRDTIHSTDPCPIHVSITDNVACPAFLGRLIRDVHNGPSPLWLQRRLIDINLRPISALVDITNYLMFDLGRPLHVFDANKLHGHLTVRLSQINETFTGLNGKTYSLDDSVTVVCDEKEIVSLGGMMGSSTTGCTEETMNVFIECALFDPIRTAKTGQTLEIDSDACYRFARGVDPESLVLGMENCTRMILDICGGKPSDVVMAGTLSNNQETLPFQPSRVRTLSGLSIPVSEQIERLKSLGFHVTETSNDSLTVIIPSWRNDIHEDVDLVEEILRLHGFEHIQAVPITRPIMSDRPRLSQSQKYSESIRRILAIRGLYEAVTWSFMDAERARCFGFNDQSLRLCNPISTELNVMRPSILPNLLQAVRRNTHRGYQNVGFFEVGPIYYDSSEKGQKTVATGVRAGWAKTRHWAEDARKVDVFDVKADVLCVLEMLGIGEDDLEIHTDPPEWYHPGRAGSLNMNGHTLAWFGEIHPAVLSTLDLNGPISGFEILIDAIPLHQTQQVSRKPLLQLSAFQSVVRDFAFIVDHDVTAEKVIGSAKDVDKELIKNVEIFDVYTGPTIGETKKSLALAVTLQAPDRTLTTPEITAISEKIISAIHATTGAILRHDGDAS